MLCNSNRPLQGRCHLFHSHRHFLSDHFTNNSSKWPCGLTPLPAIYVYCHSLLDSIITVLIIHNCKRDNSAKNRFCFSALVKFITKHKWRASPLISCKDHQSWSCQSWRSKLTHLQNRTWHISPETMFLNYFGGSQDAFERSPWRQLCKYAWMDSL